MLDSPRRKRPVEPSIAFENQIRQAQKMEAAGQLAAGLAHAFNNILTVIQGYSTLLLGTKPTDSTDRKPLQTIVASSEGARKLVRQLLTFSRKQVVQKTPMDIQNTFSDILEMLPRVLHESIEVAFNVSPDLPMIKADEGKMEQMLMNLAVNARDAMPQGGQLTLCAENVEVNSASASSEP